MLAGRKLLLADDSITIQKVVDLTFSDEGVTVVCVDNGREAIERVEEVAPDIVLADVFMPQASGYEVCEYIKQHDKLKHIPVMLLVGSFEPFDEGEARRVGADEILTKPFQSIRALLAKVGLLTDRQTEEQIPTAELPKTESVPAEEEKLSEQELAISTADTRPLPMGQADRASIQTAGDTEQMETKVRESSVRSQQTFADDVPLDLGDFEPASASAVDEFVLDIDLDDIPEYAPREAPRPVQMRSVEVEPSFTTGVRDWNATQPIATTAELEAARKAISETPEATADQFAKTQEFPRSFESPVAAPSEQPSVGSPSTSLSADQLSPEVIDAIARRAVEQLSERVVQEIAWEVVPQLAELMIKRQLEEKNS